MRVLAPTALICLLLYIVLHEFGHVIVLWSVGANVTEFSIVNAHVMYDGGEWTNLSDRWMHLNGALLPIIVSLIYMLFYRPAVKNRFYRTFSALFALIPIGSLLAWVGIPFLYVNGNAPANDDVTKFLYNFTSQYPALWVSVASLLLMAFCLFVAIRKGIFRNFYAVIREIRHGDEA